MLVDYMNMSRLGFGYHLTQSLRKLDSFWRDSGRVDYTSVTDAAALDAFDLVAQQEGILAALETSHAVAWAVEAAAAMKPEEILVVCMSGRGDKDAAEIARLRGLSEAGA